MAAPCDFIRLLEISRTSQIVIVLLSVVVKFAISADVEWGEHLLCRNCGHEVARASDLINVPSPHALHQRNETVMGKEEVLMQIFQNPGGMQFEVITSSAAIVKSAEQTFPADTWFDNFTWRIISCMRCNAHLGWCYEPGEKMKAKCPNCDDINRQITEKRRFFGLILDKVIHQQYADSLVMSPKFYGG